MTDVWHESFHFHNFNRFNLLPAVSEGSLARKLRCHIFNTKGFEGSHALQCDLSQRQVTKEETTCAAATDTAGATVQFVFCSIHPPLACDVDQCRFSRALSLGIIRVRWTFLKVASPFKGNFSRNGTRVSKEHSWPPGQRFLWNPCCL